HERDAVPVKYARYFDENAEFNDMVGATPASVSSVFANPQFGSNVNTAYINHEVMARNVAEGGIGSPISTDPLCESLSGADGQPFLVGTRTAPRGLNGGSCREYTYQWQHRTLRTK